MKTHKLVLASIGAGIVIFGTSVFAKTKVEVSVSKVHSLLVFVDAIAGSPHKPEQLTKTFNESKADTEIAKAKLTVYRDVEESMRKSVEFGKAAPGRMDGAKLSDMIETQSAFAKSLPDFRERILGHLRMEDIEKLMSVLEYFEPVYAQLIWNGNKAELDKVVIDFREKAVKWKLDELFDRAKIFYKSKWPDSQPFHVSVYPIPKEAHVSNATSLGAFESVGVIIGKSDIEGNFGVLFHEMCHSLYNAQSAAFQQQLADWFLKNPSPFGPVAYGWLNEALATAIGNGWAFEKAKGSLDKTSWYHQEKIDVFAHVLYPRVVEYLNGRKPIDEAFVAFAIKSFAEKFPDALLEFESLMSDVVVLTDGSVGPGSEVRRLLRSKFLMPSISGGSPIDSAPSKNLVSSNSAPLFLIATHVLRVQMENLEDVLPGVSAGLKKAAMKGSQVAIFDLGRRKVIILLLDSREALQSAVTWMGDNKRVALPGEFNEISRR